MDSPNSETVSKRPKKHISAKRASNYVAADMVQIVAAQLKQSDKDEEFTDKPPNPDEIPSADDANNPYSTDEESDDSKVFQSHKSSKTNHPLHSGRSQRIKWISFEIIRQRISQRSVVWRTNGQTKATKSKIIRNLCWIVPNWTPILTRYRNSHQRLYFCLIVRSFVHSATESFVQVIMNPCLEKELLTVKQSDSVFSNIKEIQQFHENLFKVLKIQFNWIGLSC